MMPSDDRHEALGVNEPFGAVESVLEHGPTADEVHELLGQLFSGNVRNVPLQPFAITRRQDQPPQPSTKQIRSIEHEDSPPQAMTFRSAAEQFLEWDLCGKSTKEVWQISCLTIQGEIRLYFVGVVAVFHK
jgi:hypothetical protein